MPPKPVVEDKASSIDPLPSSKVHEFDPMVARPSSTLPTENNPPPKTRCKRFSKKSSKTIIKVNSKPPPLPKEKTALDDKIFNWSSETLPPFIYTLARYGMKCSYDNDQREFTFKGLRKLVPQYINDGDIRALLHYSLPFTHFMHCEFDMLMKEIKAYTNGMKYKNLLISPADKMLGIVVMDRDKFFKTCDQQVQKIAKKYQGPKNLVTIRTNADKLFIPSYKTFREEILPAFTSKEISNWHKYQKLKSLAVYNPIPKTKNKKNRPIINGSQSYFKQYSYPVSVLMESNLQQFIRQGNNRETYCGDSYEFIESLDELNDKLMHTDDINLNEYQFVAADIEGYYTAMPHDMIMYCVERILKANKKDNTYEYQFIMNFYKHHFEYDIFIYKGEYYLQYLGIAMGRDDSPSLAQTCGLILERDSMKYINESTVFFKRYMDDMCMLIKKTITNISEYLIKIYKKFKFTYEIANGNSIDFLDIRITAPGCYAIYYGHFIRNNAKYEIMYGFNIKTHKLEPYINVKSNHKVTWLSSIIYGAIHRSITLTNRENIHNVNLKYICKRFAENQYPDSFYKKIPHYYDRKYLLANIWRKKLGINQPNKPKRNNHWENQENIIYLKLKYNKYQYRRDFPKFLDRIINEKGILYDPLNPNGKYRTIYRSSVSLYTMLRRFSNQLMQEPLGSSQLGQTQEHDTKD